ncbi:NAD(P)-binding domain-containing protein [Paraflavitalea sp. CAU 1676]|uniref:NADPH-dependent F420 reductase n=1 Tax=Paraflavitalea sp. CAU 1676 TaxID=3032598 RepID=UPI0023DB711F|nr:NAD(P)-binding domain-containing protein [Paraflavitalea sp. CAU 1676]MDF2192356.1 NAD(P)-binding domain-containing protein [Paraflavitalea sp. CAU 1676]
MSTTKTKVAVIGLGNIGKVVAANLVKGGRPVIIADRKEEKSRQLAQQLGTLTTPLSIPAAIKEAEIVIFAVWFPVIAELLKQYEAELEGKVIIDPSNPIAPDENGGFKKIIEASQSAGQVNKAVLPKGAKLVKAFGTLAAASLEHVAFQQPDKAVLFYTTDQSGVNSIVEELIKDSGFEPLRVGAIDQSIRIEVFGDLHEFGALGKTVTLAEAEVKI